MNTPPGFRSLEEAHVGDYVVKISTSPFPNGPKNEPWLEFEAAAPRPQPLPATTYMVLYWPLFDGYEALFDEARIVFFTSEKRVKQFMENLADGIDDPYLLWHAK